MRTRGSFIFWAGVVVFLLAATVCFSLKYVGYVWYIAPPYHDGVACTAKTTNAWLWEKWQSYAMYSAVILSYDPLEWGEVGYVKDKAKHPHLQYFWSWRDEPYGNFHLWPGPSAGSYHTYKLFDDASDGVENKFYFYVDTTVATSHVFEYSPKKLIAWVETQDCPVDFGHAHFQYICYYDGSLWPNPWRFWTAHSEVAECSYQIYDRVGNYEYKAKK